MRILFNHGLTFEELYTNTKESITNRRWRWWIKNYGHTNSYCEAISEPFKYCMKLIFDTVLKDRVRFIVPGVPEAYIDFEIVSGDKFVEHRQNGRFSEIDFIESDFTGYFMNYYFKAKAYQKVIPIYLGGELKKEFLNGINSGIKYYTIKNLTINDILPKIYENFKELPQSELKKIILHGFRRLHSAIKFGCAISLVSLKYGNCYAHIGKLTLTPEKQIKEYSIRRDRKLRKIEGWKKQPFDGYYYIGLNNTAFEKWVELNKDSRTVVKFNNIIPRKIVEEIYYKAKHLHVFKFKVKSFKGWSYWVENLKVRDLEYIGEVNQHKFTPVKKSWKELIKEYEKRSDIDI